MHINYTISLNENNIHVQIEKESNAQYACYLYHKQTQVANATEDFFINYSQNNVFNFEVQKSGIYYARVFVLVGESKKDTFTKTVLFLNDEIRGQFEQTMSSDLVTSNTITCKTPYFSVPSPQNDFCVVSTGNSSQSFFEKINVFCEENNFKCSNAHFSNRKNYIIFNNDSSQIGMKNNTIFSGYMWHEGNFYYSQNEIPQDFEIEHLHNNLGIYTSLSFHGDKILVSTDYLSYGLLFSYKKDDIFMVTNSYHMMILCLASLGEKIEISEDILYTIFASNVTLFRQTLHDKLLVENTYMLKMTEEVVINNDGANVVNKETHDVFYENFEFDAEKYRDLIYKTKDDIISNIKAVLNNKNFKNYICELSGGKDSRTVLAGLTNIENSNDTVKLYTSDAEPDDIKIATFLGKLFGFSYIDDAYIKEVDDILIYINKKKSTSLGFHWLWYVPEENIRGTETALFNANSFEAFCVRYYSKQALHVGVKFDSGIDELVDKYSHLLSRQAVINYSKFSSIIEKELKHSIEAIPGNMPLEQFDNSLMFWRGRTHTGTLDRQYFYFAAIVPLQSKSLISLKRMWVNNFEDNKIIFDLMYAINPILASVPYNNPSYNKSKEVMKEHLLQDDIRYKNVSIPVVEDLAEWERASAKRKVETVYTDSYVERGDVSDIVFENTLFLIQKLSKYKDGMYIEDICIPLYYYIVTNKYDDVEVRLIHNKLASVIDVVEI